LVVTSVVVVRTLCSPRANVVTEDDDEVGVRVFEGDVVLVLVGVLAVDVCVEVEVEVTVDVVWLGDAEGALLELLVEVCVTVVDVVVDVWDADTVVVEVL
jgi:hypothetical protein